MIENLQQRIEQARDRTRGGNFNVAEWQKIAYDQQKLLEELKKVWANGGGTQLVTFCNKL